MIRTLTKNAQHQAIRELESPTASDYNVGRWKIRIQVQWDYKDREQEYNLLFDHFVLQGGFDAGV